MPLAVICLTAGSPFAGIALALSFCRYADTTGTTIVAKALGKGRQRLYRRLGFETVAEARNGAFIVRSAAGHANGSVGHRPATSGA